MRRLGLVLALVIIAVGAWFDWTYRATRTEVAELQSRLPSEEALDQMPLEETAERLKLANIACGRVAELKASSLAHMFKGSEIDALAQQCELLKERTDALEGP